MTYKILECDMNEETAEVYDDELTLKAAKALIEELHLAGSTLSYFIVPSFIEIYD